MVLLSEHDSKKYRAALRFKKEIAENPDKFILTEKDCVCNRELDKFGEVTAKCVQRVHKRLSPEETEKVIAEYRSGKTPAELGEKYGCHRSTVSVILERNGISTKPCTDQRVKAIISGFRDGKNTYELAEEFHCSSSTVSRILKQNGMEPEKCKAQKKLDVAKVISMYADMHTAKEIAQEYGVSANVIIRCLRNCGVKIRPRGGSHLKAILSTAERDS